VFATRNGGELDAANIGREFRAAINAGDAGCGSSRRSRGQ
jgi:hypothetical protein